MCSTNGRWSDAHCYPWKTSGSFAFAHLSGTAPYTIGAVRDHAGFRLPKTFIASARSPASVATTKAAPRAHSVQQNLRNFSCIE